MAKRKINTKTKQIKDLLESNSEKIDRLLEKFNKELSEEIGENLHIRSIALGGDCRTAGCPPGKTCQKRCFPGFCTFVCV